MAMLSFLVGHVTGKTHLPTSSLSGRTVVVTGSNRGLGLHTALHLARLDPAILILAVRDTASGELAAERIRNETPYAGKVEVWDLDMSTFCSVKKFAKRAADKLERLDVVVENAGLGMMKFEKSEDGWEKTIQVNDLSTGLLALLLLPLLSKTALLPAPEGSGSTLKPHLTIVGSEGEAMAVFNERKVPGSTLATLNDPKHFVRSDRYNVSKLITIFIARELAQLPATKDVVVNVVHPGLCVSNLRDGFPRPIPWIINQISWSTAYGAQTIAWAAVDATEPGAYVAFSKEVPSSAFSRSAEGLASQQKLWGEMSEEWVKVAPEVESALKL